MGTDKKNYLLESFLVILILIFVTAVFVKSGKEKNAYIKTVLLNPKYENSISQITIDVPGSEKLFLKKTGNIWYGEQYSGTDESEKILWPADKNTVENLIKNSIKIKKLYKKTDLIKNHKKLNLTEESARKINFYSNDGQLLSEIYFGKENSLTSRIALRSSAKKDVYETEDDYSFYLNTQSYLYADPYIFPLAVTSFSKQEESSLLRHGIINGFTKDNERIKNEIPVNTLRKDFADGSTVTLKIYSLKENKQNQYTVVPYFKPSPAAGIEEMNIINKFNYTYSISSWTYEKIILQQ